MMNSQKIDRASKAAIIFSVLLGLLSPSVGAARQTQKSPLEWAMVLVRELRAEDTSYQHKHGFINWKGEAGATAYESRTDCSGFANALLEHSYGFNASYFQKWLKTARPLAIDYHDAIESQRGFDRIQQVREIEPGDIIAIRYPPDSENSGHIMLAAKVPQKRQPSKPEIEGLRQWEVAVIDSSRSGHGKTDTRHRDDNTFGSGVGEGILRLYANRDGTVAGYTWSVFSNSDYYDQQTRHLVVGRLDPRFKP